MKDKLLTIAAVTGALLFGQTDAPSLAEKLEQARYAQETAGNLDEAIRIYRDILASAQSRGVAAQAQYRLTQTILQKGDLDAARVEMAKLASSYPDYAKAIAEFNLTALRSTGHTDGVRLGKLEFDQRGGVHSSRYTHNVTRIELTAGEGWMVTGDNESSGGGEMLQLLDKVSGATAFVWMRPYDGHGDIEAELQGDVRSKSRDRDPSWKVRPTSIQRRAVAGEQALSAVADYVSNGRPMVEYMVWIRNTRSRLLFSVRTHPDDFTAHQARFDHLISSVRMP